MKKLLLLLLILALSFNIVGQEKEKGRFFKNVYKELFKYSTIYVAGDMQNPKEEAKDYFVRTNPDGGLYDIPTVIPPNVVVAKSFKSNLFPGCVASKLSLQIPTAIDVIIPATNAFFLSFVLLYT